MIDYETVSYTHLPGNAIIAHNEGVDLLPSNIELSGMETGLFNVMSREYVLKMCIRDRSKSARWPSASPMTRRLLSGLSISLTAPSMATHSASCCLLYTSRCV